jgi:hypothetical protein
MCGYFKPSFLFGKGQFCYDGSSRIFRFSAKTAYFPLLVILLLSFIIFTVFRAIGENGIGGMDALAYKERFDAANQPLIQSLINQANEPLYGLFVWIIRKMSSDFRFFLLCYYLTLFIIQIKILSKIDVSVITIFSYFAICFFLIIMSFCLMRNTLSMFICWLVYIDLDKKKYIKSIVLITIAVLIHFSAVICYPVWLCLVFADKNNFSLKKAIWCWIVMFILCFLLRVFMPAFLVFFDKKYATYLNDTGLALNTFIGRSYLIFLAIWKFKILIQHNSMNRIMLVVLLVNLLVIPLQSVLPIMYRMLMLADPAVFFLVPELICAYAINRKNYLINILIRISLFVYLLLSIYSFISGMSNYGLDNYSNVLLSPNGNL